jgi:hypothetical protein
MSDYSFTTDDMLEPIQRLFEREYAKNLGMFEKVDDDLDDEFENVDALFIGGSRESLHAIDIHEDYDSCLFDISGGIHTLPDIEVNYRWIALSLDEFREGEEEHNGILKEEANSRGFGIITLQPKGRGISAKVIEEPTRSTGDYLEDYQELDARWNRFVEEAPVVDDYKVVNYYDK